MLVSAECYFTARYFHPPAEIVLAAAIGAALFQLPLLAYVKWAFNQHSYGPATANKPKRARAAAMAD